jgi:hypothetical protein
MQCSQASALAAKQTRSLQRPIRVVAGNGGFTKSGFYRGVKLQKTTQIAKFNTFHRTVVG